MVSEMMLLVWQAVQDLIDEQGYAPTYREIGARVFLAHSGVSMYLQKLAAAGVLSIEEKQPRSIKLLMRLDIAKANAFRRRNRIKARRRQS